MAVESTWRIVPPAMSGFIPVKLIRSFGVGVTPHMAAKAKLSDLEHTQLHYVMAAHAEVHGLDPEH